MTVQEQPGTIRITFVSKKGETLSNINPAATDADAYACAEALMALLTEQTSTIVRNRRSSFAE